MTEAVREAINEPGRQVSRTKRGIEPRDILEVIFVGNPIMHHLLLGIDPTELGGAPFALATDRARSPSGPPRSSSSCIPTPAIYVLPCIAGHVGADTAGVILSEAPASVRRDDAARRCRHQCRDRARQPPPAARRLLADRPGLRGRADLLRPARSARAPSSGCASIPRRWSRASRSSAPTNGRTSRASPRRRRATGVTGICGSGIIEALAEMYPGRHHHPGRRGRRQPRGALATHPAGGAHLLLSAL